jgi:hypothetical protein
MEARIGTVWRLIVEEAKAHPWLQRRAEEEEEEFVLFAETYVGMSCIGK